MRSNQNYHTLIVPVTLGIERTDGKDMNVQIWQELLHKGDKRFSTTGIFSLYVDTFGLDKGDLEDLIGSDVYDLPDEKSPEYLGRILFDKNGYWIYDGNQLAISEQEQIGEFIRNYEEKDFF